MTDILAGGAKLSLPPAEQNLVRRHITLPKLLSNALLIYTLTPRSVNFTSSCTRMFIVLRSIITFLMILDVDFLIPPLLVHKSHPEETHYYRLAQDKPIALHTHASAPYIPLSGLSPSYGAELWIYSPDCQDINEFSLTINWWATIGRIGTRYATTLVCFSISVVALLMFYAWRGSMKGTMPSVQQSLVTFICCPMPKLLAVSFVVALFPLSPNHYMGTRGELFFGPLAPVLLVVATGLVSVSWWIVLLLIWPLRLLGRLLPVK